MTAQLGHLGLDTATPESVRALAEKTVAQTREAYDLSKDAFDASVTTFERSFDAAGQGATAFNRKIVDIARRNVDTSFDLAKSLASAKNLTDIVDAGGLLAQAVRRIGGSSRGGPRLDQGDAIRLPKRLRVLTDEELIEGLSFSAYHRVSTVIFVPGPSGSAVEMV